MNLGRTRGVVEIMDIGDFDPIVSNEVKSITVAVEAPKELVTASAEVNGQEHLISV